MTREMKDTGIEWIGKIPINWEVVPSNLFFYSSTEKVNAKKNDKINQLTASQKYGVISQKKYMELESQVPVQKQNLTDLKRVDKDDFVISLRSFEGGIEIAQESGGITPAYTVIKERTKQTNSNYYKYLFKSNMYIQALRGTVLDTIRDGKSIKYNHFSMVPILLPSIQKQVIIAKKLDELNENIDSLVRNTQQSIEELKKYKQSLITEAVTKGLNPNVEMKKSGSRWIDCLPKHWGITKVKNLFTIKNGGTPSSSQSEYWLPNEIVWYTPQDLSSDKVHTLDDSARKISIKGLNNSSARIVKENSIVLSTRAPIGNIKLSTVPFSTNQGCKSLEAKENINIKYYFYFMKIQKEILNSLGRGTTFLELSNQDLKEFMLFFPPLKEQLEIATYLDGNSAQIGKIIEAKQKVIEELQQYKKSLIYEYVTGKKEV